MTRFVLLFALAAASQAADLRDYQECRRAGYRTTACHFAFNVRPMWAAIAGQWDVAYVAGYWAGYEYALRGAQTSYSAPPLIYPAQPAIVQPEPTRRQRRGYTETQTRIGGYVYTTGSDGRQCTSWRQGADWVTQCY